MLEAALWGLVTAGSLWIGAALAVFARPAGRWIGLAMAFGSGALIAAVAYELVFEAFETDSAFAAVGFAIGALAFYGGDWAIDRRGGHGRKSASGQHQLAGRADAIVLGTILARAAEEVAGWAARLGRRFAAGIDARDGKVKVTGWTEDAGLADTEFAAALLALGMPRIIYTNISRDGTLAGPDIPRTNAVARAADLPTVLSGGIGSEEDVARTAAEGDQRVVGVILGKALYEGRVDLASLVRRFPQAGITSWDDPTD